MLRNMYQRDYYAYLGINQGNYDEKTERQLHNVRETCIRLIEQYQGYCNSVIERINQIVEEEVMKYPCYLELRRYRNEASERSNELIKEIEGKFYDVVIYSDRLNDPIISEPFLIDFKEKIMDVLWQTDRKIKLILGVHNVTCSLFFFK